MTFEGYLQQLLKTSFEHQLKENLNQNKMFHETTPMYTKCMGCNFRLGHLTFPQNVHVYLEC